MITFGFLLLWICSAAAVPANTDATAALSASDSGSDIANEQALHFSEGKVECGQPCEYKIVGSQCAHGATCKAGVCVEGACGAPLGTPCEWSDTSNTCTNAPQGADNHRACINGKCANKLPCGAKCTHHLKGSECQSGSCSDGKCGGSVCTDFEATRKDLTPIIEIPGLLSSELYKYYSNTGSYLSECTFEVDCNLHPWKDDNGFGCCKMWVTACNSGKLPHGEGDCYPAEDFSANWDSAEKKFITGGHACPWPNRDDSTCTAKVDVGTPGVLGATNNFEWIYLSSLKLSASDVFGAFNRRLREKMGYEYWKTLWGASYDFRRVSPNYMDEEYGPQLKALVEKVYVENGNKKVILIGHSLGAAVSTAFLNSDTIGITAEWKAKYIHANYLFAPAHGGSAFALAASANGVTPTADCGADTDAYWKFGWKIGLMPVLPHPWVFKNKTVLTLDGKDYQAHQLHKVPSGTYYEDASFKEAFQEVAMPLWERQLKDPGVKTVVMYRSGLPTPESVTAGAKKLECDGEGDQTVPTIGLKYAADNWKDVISRDYKDICPEADMCQHKAIVSSDCLFYDVKATLENGQTKFDPDNKCTKGDGAFLGPDGILGA